MVIIDKPCIFAEPGDVPFESSAVIFASKHVSSTGTPALTVHATGNLTKSADFGGNPEEVSMVDPAIVRQALRGLKEGVSRTGFAIDVTMEATHHGPTSFSSPVCFVEIGSGPREWSDPLLGKIAADAIMSAAMVQGERLSAVGFGGPHYSAKFTKECLDGHYQIGHIIPKHAFESGVSSSVVKETFTRTIGECTTGVVDWKGLPGGERQRLVASLEGWGYKVVRS